MGSICSRAIDEFDDLRQRADWIDRHTFNHTSFASISQRDEQVGNFPIACQHGDRQHTFHGPELPIQRQFADHQVIRNILFGEQAKSAEDTDRHRKVEGRTLFFYICRSEVNDNLLIWSTVAVVADRRKYTVFRFPNGSIRQADDYSLAIAAGC